MPIIYLDRSATGAMAAQSGTSTTIGDLSLLPRIFFSPTIFSKPANLQLALGASLPISNGSFKAETNQRDFTSGTVDPLLSATLAALVGGGANAFVSLFSRLTLAESKGENNVNRESGDLYSIRAGVTRALIGEEFRGILRLRWTHFEPDAFDSLGVMSEIGGADFFSMSPGLSATLIGSGEGAVRGWLQVDIPIRQHVRGNQLTEEWSLSLGLTTGLKLFGHDEKPAHGLHKH